MKVYDFAVIGAGMAGASLAAELADSASVLLLEAEDTPGYHATGRSAAFWEECYGGPDIVPLTLATGPYLAEHGFLNRRGALYVARDEDMSALDEFMNSFADTGVNIVHLGGESVKRRLPGVQPQWTAAAWEPACADIDVAALHAHYLALGRSRGLRLKARASVVGLDRTDGVWHVETANGQHHRAICIVNAAGAWADRVAVLAGAKPIGIAPLRRTVVQLRTDPVPPADMPLVLDVNGRFYFKPEAGRLWLSPQDEVPSEPCDAAPEELAVAEAIALLEEVVDWRIEAVERRWAGLRSFAPDRKPVYGFDPQAEGFAWFAGQGGFGIQTAPAAARLGSQLLLGNARDAMTAELDAALYAPSRFV